MNREKAEKNDDIETVLRGCETVCTREELEERLKSGKSMRVKLGLDPTAPDIHLGHVVVLRKLKSFQDLGHKAVIIIGDYTAKIGDPTGANKTRPVLTDSEIKSNAKTYFDQAGKILAVSEDKLDVRYNSEWLESLSFEDVLKMAGNMTVARMMERDTFKNRFRDNKPIGIHEFLYPLMQGYDSIRVEADVELGGTDQTFNNLVGRDMQEKSGMRPQVVMTMPILRGLDGTEKMSKSKGNFIAINDTPRNMFGKVMSIPDDIIDHYYLLLTPLPEHEIAAICDPEKTHPRKAKARLARTIVEQFYGTETAAAAEREFDHIFKEQGTPEKMPETRLDTAPLGIVNLVVGAGLASSRGEAKRLIRQGAVSIDGKKITAVEQEVDPNHGQVLKVGKRRFARLVKD